MKLHLVAFGKIRTPGLRDTVDYYKKLLTPWAPVEEYELKPLAVPEKSSATRARIQKEEEEILEERLRKILGTRGAFILLDESGKALPTREWAAKLRSFEDSSIPDLAFCVGSSLGFSAAMRARAKALFSLGPQTLSHELARAVLMEQLYRAWSVNRGHPYHNEA